MIFTSLACVALGLAVIAAGHDYAQMRLPNRIVLALIGLFAAACLAPETPITALPAHAMAAFIVFAVSAAMFASGTLGAGDAKMATVIALWVGLKGLPVFLLVMSLCGMVLAFTALAFRRSDRINPAFFAAIPARLRPESGWLDRLHHGENALPYGIAIAAGAIVAFAQNGWLPTL